MFFLSRFSRVKERNKIGCDANRNNTGHPIYTDAIESVLPRGEQKNAHIDKHAQSQFMLSVHFNFLSGRNYSLSLYQICGFDISFQFHIFLKHQFGVLL